MFYFVYYVNILMTPSFEIFQRFLQKLSEGQTNFSEIFPKNFQRLIYYDCRRFLKIHVTEDFQGRTDDIWNINYRNTSN